MQFEILTILIHFIAYYWPTVPKMANIDQLINVLKQIKFHYGCVSNWLMTCRDQIQPLTCAYCTQSVMSDAIGLSDLVESVHILSEYNVVYDLAII